MPVQIHRIWLHVWFFLCWIYRLYRVGQNHKYMVYIRYCWLEKLPKITKYTINVYIYGSGQPYVYTPYIWRYVWSSANPAVSRAILIHRVQEPFVPCFKSLARSAYCLLCHASNRWRAVRIAFCAMLQITGAQCVLPFVPCFKSLARSAYCQTFVCSEFCLTSVHTVCITNTWMVCCFRNALLFPFYVFTSDTCASSVLIVNVAMRTLNCMR